MKECEHVLTRTLYQQLPPSQGRKLSKVTARVCVDCKAVLQ